MDSFIEMGHYPRFKDHYVLYKYIKTWSFVGWKEKKNHKCTILNVSVSFGRNSLIVNSILAVNWPFLSLNFVWLLQWEENFILFIIFPFQHRLSRAFGIKSYVTEYMCSFFSIGPFRKIGSQCLNCRKWLKHEVI